MKKTNKNKIILAKIIAKIVEENYEPGVQRKSRLQVYRHIIKKQYPMSERTFWKMLEIAKKTEIEK